MHEEWHSVNFVCTECMQIHIYHIIIIVVIGRGTYTYKYTIIGNVCNKLNALEGSNQMKSISRSCHVHQVLYIYTVSSVARLFEVPCMLQEGSHVPLHL